MRAARSLALAAAGACVLAACTGGGAAVSTGGGDRDDDGNVLVAAVSAQPDQFDPHRTSAYPSFQVLENVYDTLVVPSAEDLTMEPSLAASWETSADGLTWRFTLRDDVTFHDGSTFDSADVVYSYRRIVDEDLANASRFATVASVEADGPQTVVLRLTRPTPNLLALLGAFKGMAIVAEGDGENLDLTTEANGTGPFELAAFDPSSTRLTAFDDYWGGEPEIDGVEFRYLTDPAAALAALEDGAVDWTDNLPPRELEALAGDDDVELARRPSVDYWYLAMNHARPPFDDVRVRRAVATGVDRAAVTDAARPGAARPNQTAIPEGSFFHSGYAPFSSDPDAARQQLDEAGVDDPLTMGLMVTDEFPESVEAARAVADQLAPVGITVQVEVLDFASWLRRQADGDFDALMLTWLGNLDPADFYEQAHLTGGSSNYQGYSNPEVDRLLTEAATEVDRSARKALYDRAAALIVDDVSYLYLYNPDVVQAWTPGLTGYRIRADRAINFEDVELP